MSLALEPSCLRTQKATSEPSGEKPRVRTSGLTSSAALPRVRLWNRPEPTWVTQTSVFPVGEEGHEAAVA
jgi:hypothetical protein